MAFEKTRQTLGEARKMEERGLELLEEAGAVKIATPASPTQAKREIDCATAIQRAKIECAMGYLADARIAVAQAHENAQQEAEKLEPVGEVKMEAELPEVEVEPVKEPAAPPPIPGPDPRVVAPADNGPPPWAGQPGTPGPAGAVPSTKLG